MNLLYHNNRSIASLLNYLILCDNEPNPHSKERAKVLALLKILCLSLLIEIISSPFTEDAIWPFQCQGIQQLLPYNHK